MLPPHRPFREKPTVRAVVKKRKKLAKEELIAISNQQGARFALKQPLVVLSEAADKIDC